MRREDYNEFTTTIKKGTEKAKEVLFYVNRNGYGDIYNAYEKPSYYKIRSYEMIKERANKTEGYNHDLRVIGKNCMQYSTIYTFTEGGKTYAVKDTKANCYITEL